MNSHQRMKVFFQIEYKGGVAIMNKGNLKYGCPEILMAILRHTKDSIFVKDTEGVIIAVSDAKANNSGVLWKYMVGKTDFDFLPFEEAQRCREDEILIMKTGKSIVKEEELTRPDGKKVWVSVSKSCWRDEKSGSIMGIVGTARDISRPKRMEKYILNMVTITMHDVCSSLFGVYCMLDVISRGRFGEISEGAGQKLLGVRDKISGLEKKVRGHLTVSSIMSSDGIGHKEILDLRQGIFNSILNEELAWEISRKNIQIKDCLSENLDDRVLVLANRDQLEIACLNLLSNSVKYTPIGGTVTLGFENRAGESRINVSNDSEPIPLEMREIIFEMFKSGSGSSGVGLAISRDIIRRHGGDLRCEELNGHPNFVITLPKE